MKPREDFEPNSDPEVDQHGKLKIGPFLFGSDISLTLKRRIKHLYRSIKYKVQTLRMQNGRLKELIPEEALELAESYTFQYLQHLHLAKNKLQSISILQKCSFPNLIVLNLSQNTLWSLTDIWNNLHFPNIEQIHLHNNHIVSLRGIKRWKLGQLHKLTFELNYIASIDDLSKADLPALRELILYSNQIRDFRPVFKVGFPNLQSFQIYQNPTCDRRIIYKALTSKFKFLQMHLPPQA